MEGFTKKFVKRELIITLKSHNNNFPSVVCHITAMCLWMPVACVCVRACVCVHIYSLRLPYFGVFHSLLSAIGFQSCFFFTADVSPPIRSTLHLLTFYVSFQAWAWLWYPMLWFQRRNSGAHGAENSIQISALAGVEPRTLGI